MTAVVVLLVVTNLVTLAVLVIWRRADSLPEAETDGDTFTSVRPAGVSGRTRRLISIEILNPLELVSTRGRFAGFAGSLVPGIARRVVYDQTLKILRRELEDKQVLADVRIHTLRPAPRPAPPSAVTPSTPGVIDLQPIPDLPTTPKPSATTSPPITETIDIVTPVDLELGDELPEA